MRSINGMFIICVPITRGADEIVLADDADRTGVRRGRGHQPEYGIDEAPVAVEKS